MEWEVGHLNGGVGGAPGQHRPLTLGSVLRLCLLSSSESLGRMVLEGIGDLVSIPWQCCPEGTRFWRPEKKKGCLSQEGATDVKCAGKDLYEAWLPGDRRVCLCLILVPKRVEVGKIECTGGPALLFPFSESAWVTFKNGPRPKRKEGE